MKSKKTNNGYVIRLEKGEEIVETITDFCEDNLISGASIKGIGGISSCEIAYLSRKQKEYLKKEFVASKIIKNEDENAIFELLNLQGNITLVNGKVFLHAHVILSDKDMNTFGGHLVKAIISPTCELFLEEVKDEDNNRIMIKRKKDDESGLNLIDL